ncbi:MAG: hypothetical protein FWC03_12035 [Treponema sp.]|nr:hypothetical protein [Treponema sp.]
MKKLFIGFLIIVCCTAIGIHAQTLTNDQRFIGRWVDEDSSSWVFNTNGTLVLDNYNYKWFSTSTFKLMIMTVLAIWKYTVNTFFPLMAEHYI